MNNKKRTFTLWPLYLLLFIMVQNFRFKVAEKRPLAKNVFFYTLDLLEPAVIEFKAGQFLNIKINEKTWKPYSICSKPSTKNKIEFVVDISPGGEGSAFFEKLETGQEILGSGPFGTFTIGESSCDPVFIATGSGIAPIRAMINDMIDRKDKRKITLFFGVRYTEDVYFFEEFEQGEKLNPNFKFYGTLSKPDENWQGLNGRVTDHLEKVGEFDNKDYYLCGKPSTVEALKIYLISCGVKDEKIHYEQY